MTHWLQIAATLLRSDVSDLKELAKLAGGDPHNFYIGTRLDGVNICGQDLRGMQFTGMDYAAVFFDDFTELDNKYWHQLYKNPNAVQLLSQGREVVPNFEALQPEAAGIISTIVREKYAVDRGAKIFRAILDNRQIGTLVVLNYPLGRSATEAKAVSALRYVIEGHTADDDAVFNISVTRALDDCLYHTSPYNRSDYFRAAIEHLGDCHAIRPFLISKVKKSKLRSIWQSEEVAKKLGLSFRVT